MKTRTVATALAVAISSLGVGRWAVVDADVPIDTILPTLTKRIAANPNDAQAHYILGRVHSLAFASGTSHVRVIPAEQREGDRWFAPYTSILVSLPENAPLTAERRLHLQSAIEHYEIATKLEPRNALYLLGLGWLRESAARLGALRPDAQREEALRAYHQIIRLRARLERTTRYGIAPDSRLALEAAQGVLRLIESRTDRAAEKERQRLKALVGELEAKPMPITPIVVPLYGESKLSDLLDPKGTTRFDLAGDGVSREWPWVRPTTGILVWDPRGTGEITSGRQLFGSSTWWMFFRTGYEAMATLDANGDEWLSGSELIGIGVWQDANGDGRSTPTEIRPAGAMGIEALACGTPETSDGSPYQTIGVRFAGGRTAPSFDWTPTSLPRERAQ